MKKLEKLLVSEIKKAESAANKFYRRNDCKVTGYFYNGADEFGNYKVKCEICFNYEERAENDVCIYVFMADRHRSKAKVVV